MLRRAALATALVLIAGQAFPQASEVATAQRVIREKLREPKSARFIDLTAMTRPNLKGQPTRVVCGKVSARTGTGGMSEAIRFVFFVAQGSVNFARDTIALERDELGVGSVVVANFCPA